MGARRIIVDGRVQGVFYRNWTVGEARALGLSGWVRNLRAGEVEILAIGPDEAIDALVERCRKGPTSAFVTELRIQEVEPESLQGFSKRPTA